MTHLTFDEISELAESRTEHPHMAACAECRETLRKVRELITAAHALPRDAAPPPEVWTALRSRVSRERAPARSRTWLLYSGWVAAAAVLVLAVWMNGRAPGRLDKLKAAQLSTSSAADPVVLLAVEKNYVGTVADLRLALESQRASLAPATIRVLEHSLAAIDTAIAEAREALARDPANEMLVRILSANYERKVELLQRATELSSSS